MDSHSFWKVENQQVMRLEVCDMNEFGDLAHQCSQSLVKIGAFSLYLCLIKD